MAWDDLYNINDTYKIKHDLEDIKKMILEIEDDIFKFLGPNKPKKRGDKARSKIRKLKNELLPEMAKKS